MLINNIKIQAMAVSDLSKCRVCLQENINMKLLSSEYLISGELLIISDIITASTSLKLMEHEEYPKHICESCLKDADTSLNFKKRCEKSEVVLQQTLIDKNNINEENKDNFNFYVLNSDKLLSSSSSSSSRPRINLRWLRRRSKIQTHSDDSSDHHNYEESDENIKYPEITGHTILKYAKEKNSNDVFECICCNETFQEISNMRAHMHSHKIFKCKICNKKFTILSNLRRHLRKSHTVKVKTDDDDVIDDDVLEFKCIGCEQTFPKRKLLSEHLKAHKDFVCRVCKAKFTFAANLRKHLYLHKRQIRVWRHIPSEKRTCDVCFKVFKYRPSMLKHRKKHDANGKECKFCAGIFENSIKLYKHMDENHEDKKDIICQECGKKFFREWNLKMHMIVHSGAKPFMCEMCGASFALQGNLASHKRLHTGHKPYKCETCGKSFTQQAALRSHEAGHSNRRDHVCPDCGAAFSRAGAMRNHRKRHLSNKPFACTMCDKKFTFSSERKRHMAIHTGEKKHVCEFCGNAFNRPANLTVHRRIHTGEMPYKCDICGKGFVQAHCMRTHRNTHLRREETQNDFNITETNI